MGIRKFIQAGVAAGAFAVIGAGAAQAQDASGPAWSFNVGVTSDYVFRGVSQSDSEPAIQGGVDVSIGSFYAGAWSSSIDFGLDEEAEVDFYAGFKPVVNGITYDFGLIYYYYPGLEGSFNGDMIEFKAGLSGSPVEKLTLGANVFYSPEFTFTSGEAGVYVEGYASYAVNDTVSISGGIGNQDVDVAGYYTDAVSGDSTDSYLTWNLGASFTIGKFTLDARYYDTDLDDVELRGPSGDTLSDERFVASAKFVF